MHNKLTPLCLTFIAISVQSISYANTQPVPSISHNDTTAQIQQRPSTRAKKSVISVAKINPIAQQTGELQSFLLDGLRLKQFNLNFEKASVNLQGLNVHISGKLQQNTVNPAFNIKLKKINIEPSNNNIFEESTLKGFQIKANIDANNSGNSLLKINQILVYANPFSAKKGDDRFQLDKLRLKCSGQVNKKDQTIDTAFHFSVKNIALTSKKQQQQFGPSVCDININKIDQKLLLSLANEVNKKRPSDHRISELFLKILSKGVTANIPQCNMQSSFGNAQIKASMEVVKHKNLSSNPLLLLPYINFNLHLKFSKSLVDNIAKLHNNYHPAQMLKLWEKKGYLQSSGNQYQTNIIINKGNITINGRSLNE